MISNDRKNAQIKQYELGSGSWYSNVSFDDYRENMTAADFRKYCYQQCKERFLKEGVELGDLIRVTVVGRNKPRKHTGVITSLSGDEKRGYFVNLQQKKTDKIIGMHWIDTVEILEKKLLLVE